MSISKDDFLKGLQKAKKYIDKKIEGINSKIGVSTFTIHEDNCTITIDDTKGSAPYSTTYGMTYVTVDPDSGVKWVEGALYTFICNTKFVVASANRNVAIRIGEDDEWHPVMGYTSSILNGSGYFIKAMTSVFTYKSSIRNEGALHLSYDSNTTYAYLVNTVPGNSTDAPLTIDDNGYGARYSLIFACTPLSDENGLVSNEKYSSLVASAATGSTKKIVTPTSGKFYIDRHPLYVNSASVAAGAKPVNSLYQDYTGGDLRYTYNTNSTYCTAQKKVFLWLKNYNPKDMSFEADATVGNIMSLDKISTRFPNTVEGDVYLYFLGWNTSTWYTLSPAFTTDERIYKYTPSTGNLVTISGKADVYSKEFGDYINSVVDIPKIVTIDQATYDTITHDANTLYFIVEDK